MGNRKQPFGYQIQRGEIVILPAEAEAVKRIYDAYAAGASYNALVQMLREESVPYDIDKQWNKNMVARILEDQRYIGNSHFPAIITPQLLRVVQEKRKKKNVLTEDSKKRKILRQLSGVQVTEELERELHVMLNSLLRHPEQLCTPPMKSEHQEPTLLQKELDKVLACNPIDEDRAQALIQQIATARYGNLDSNEYETERLRHILTTHSPSNALDLELLQTVVQKIVVSGNKVICLKLKNNQKIERG